MNDSRAFLSICLFVMFDLQCRNEQSLETILLICVFVYLSCVDLLDYHRAGEADGHGTSHQCLWIADTRPWYLQRGGGSSRW